MAKSFATVKAEAVVIRDETVTNANTATRVGTAMLDTLDTSEEAINTVSNQKVNISDIVDSLSSVETSKPLSANQGKVLNDKKVDRTRNVIAGNGLTGGGALSSDITMNVAATNDSIVIAADSIKVDTIDSLSNTSTTKPLSANQGKVLNDAKVAKTQSVNAGNGLTGGGALSGNVTLNVVASDDSIVVAADSIKVDTVDALVSTSTTKPLSAKQGKALNDALNELDKKTEFYNVTTRVPLSGGTFYNLSTAIGAIESQYKKIGFKTTFEVSANIWQSYQFTGSSISTWATASNWKLVSVSGLYGNIAISTDLNSIVQTGDYTCYGTASNVPSASYSWFVEHRNSGVGVVSAYQRAIAYSTEIIIYERTKIASTWGAWEIQGSASNVKVTPTGGITSTNVQNALAELDADIRLYKDLQVVFSIDANMNLLVNIPDPVNDEFSLNSNGELILTY